MLLLEAGQIYWLFGVDHILKIDLGKYINSAAK